MLCKDWPKLWERSRHVVLYLFFGVVTTLVNLAAYYLCYHRLGLPNLVSSAVAWAVAVQTAFITNKLWVFESRGKGRRETLRELGRFYYCRLATGGLDLAIMYVGVDLLAGPPVLLKALADVLATVINYLASRFLIFHYQGRAARLKACASKSDE